MVYVVSHPKPILQTSSETSSVKRKYQSHAAYVLIFLRVMYSSQFLSATHNDAGREYSRLDGMSLFHSLCPQLVPWTLKPLLSHQFNSLPVSNMNFYAL